MQITDPDAYRAFDDPTLDRLLGLVLALGAEVWVLKDRIMLLEEVLSSQRTAVPAAIEKAAADPARVAETERQRDEFLERFLRPIRNGAAPRNF